MIDSQALRAPLARDGMVRALAVATARRSRLLPGVPALREAGVAGHAASSWQSLQAPAGTPAPVLARLVAAVPAGPAVLARHAEAGIAPLAGGPAEAARFIRAGAERNGRRYCRAAVLAAAGGPRLAGNCRFIPKSMSQRM